MRERFGNRIAALLLAVSEDEYIAGYAAGKAALRHQVCDAGEEALMLFAADKISKARELRVHPDTAPRSRRRRLTNYRACLRLLEEQLPHSPLVRELDTELEALAQCDEQAPSRRHALRRGAHLRAFENPDVGSGQTRDPVARPFFNRSRHRTGMVTGAVVSAFSSTGWGWGGSWAGSTKDYMHVSATGH